MKSLHQFLIEKKRTFGARINGDKPSYLEATIAAGNGATHPFKLLSLPFYMIGELPRLAEAALDGKIAPFKPYGTNS